MKARIFGTIFVLAILGALYIVMNDDSQGHPANVPQPTTSEPAIQPLKIQ
jgi:hypothetical protein